MGCACSSPKSHFSRSFHQRYEMGDKIGDGPFSQVRKCRDLSSGNRYVVKIVVVDPMETNMASAGVNVRDKLSILGEPLALCARTEVNIHRLASRHENIVTLHRSFVETGVCYSILDACEYPYLQYLVDAPGKITESRFALVIQQMMAALQHIHILRIVHRHVTHDNFLCSGDLCWGGSAPCVKLCDFGLAAMLPENTINGLEGLFGCNLFMSPEMVRHQKYGTCTDIWSLGVIVYLLLFGDWPYASPSMHGADIHKVIMQHEPGPSYLVCKGYAYPKVSSAGEAFVRSLLTHDAWKRPSAKCWESHRAWFKGDTQEIPSLRMHIPVFEAAAVAELENPDANAGDISTKSVLQQARNQFKSPCERQVACDPSEQCSLDDFLTREQRRSRERRISFTQTLGQPLSGRSSVRHNTEIDGATSHSALAGELIDLGERNAKKKSRHSTHDGLSINDVLPSLLSSNVSGLEAKVCASQSERESIASSKQMSICSAPTGMD